jgi:molybdate transport system substrate-binding protein
MAECKASGNPRKLKMIQAGLASLPCLTRAALAALLVFCWCRSADAQTRDPLLVYGAASLKNALDDANAQYDRGQSRRTVLAYYAGSPELARQIENGAPADLFISADLDWMDYLEERKLIKPETRTNLLGNKLVLIASKENNLSLTIGPNFPLARALGDGRLAIADPGSVPAGKYGKASLESLGVWASVANRILPMRDVRDALQVVSDGHAPLGIVYQTDAAADKRVRIVGAFPEGTHPPIIYPLAVVTSSVSKSAAPYMQYLRSSAAAPAFEKQGFVVLPLSPSIAEPKHVDFPSSPTMRLTSRRGLLTY